MNRFLMRFRMPLAITAALFLTIVLARLFSGPEDTWIKNEQGVWVKHGCPSGPPPGQGYQEPHRYIVIPFLFLAAFAIPFAMMKSTRFHNRLTFDKATREIKLFGYMGTSLVLLGILVSLAVILELFLSGIYESTESPKVEVLFLLGSLEVFGGLCVIAGLIMFMMKQQVNDHYQIEKSHREILELTENFLRNH